MSKIKRILTVQDLSCVGQCSLTVALPILSSFGLETCVLPTAILSNHTAFGSFTFKDLTEDIPKILSTWENENIKFDAFYSGYIGSVKQIEYFKDIIKRFANDGAVTIVDPVMGDNGTLYTGFDESYIDAVKELINGADIILPNITEASMLTGLEYKHGLVDENYVKELVKGLSAFDVNKIVITGVCFDEFNLGVAMYDKQSDELNFYFNETVKKMSHGTGDVFASSFTGAYLNTGDFYKSAKIAADFTVKSLKETIPDKSHWYGVYFENVLKENNIYLK